ncbi:MAG TPA: GNAT family N-acetyltransferase [Pseudonocardiaceae bacterium]
MLGALIRSFDVHRASRNELEEFYRISVASAADAGDELPAAFAAQLTVLRNPGPELGPVLRWAAYLDERMVGYSGLRLPDGENAHVGIAKVTVHPDFRGRGLGIELLREMLPALRAADRTDVEAWSVLRGSAGERWAVRLGCRQVQAAVRQWLEFDSVDASLWEVPAPAGYRAVSWIGSAPDELVESYAMARRAIDDAPHGPTAYRAPPWTVERVREAEAAALARRAEGRVVAAVCEADGEVAGFTELWVRPDNDVALQRDTAVLERHRGHGLGRYIKSRMALSLRSDHPELRSVLTLSEASNSHMIRVNRQIGFTVSRTDVVLNSQVTALKERLDAS